MTSQAEPRWDAVEPSRAEAVWLCPYPSLGRPLGRTGRFGPAKKNKLFYSQLGVEPFDLVCFFKVIIFLQTYSTLKRN
jgi:hypothetical protein